MDQQHWGNPIYKTGERQIGTNETMHLGTGTSTQQKISEANQGKRSTTVFTAKDLADAEVLGQVDRKFVACAIRRHSQEGDVLILVDQHAADERIRVERFLQEYCEGALAFGGMDANMAVEGMELATLQPSALVLLSRREADLLYTAEVRDHLRRWGFEVDERKGPPASDKGEDGRCQVGVSVVPKLLENKVSF
jgi:DNA mismatch repair protein MLH3